MKRILFVCTGNTCRSPMAQALFKKLLKDHLRPEELQEYEVLSAGIYAMDGEPASFMAVEVMAENDIDLQEHKAQKITEEIIKKADIILTMTESHRIHLINQFPEFARRIHVISHFNGYPEDVYDPFGRGKENYLSTYRQLQLIIEGIVEKILNDCLQPGGYDEISDR